MNKPYDTAEILRQNVTDLERELQRQRERADKAIAEARADLQSFIDSRDAWMARAEKAEAELKAARERLHPEWKGRNEYGLDVDYFRRKLEQVLRDLNRFTPEEFARAMATHSRTADDSVIAKEFSVPIPAPAPAVPSGCVAHLTQLADDPCQCHCCRTKRREARALLQSAGENP